jgi:hypothetical protein
VVVVVVVGGTVTGAEAGMAWSATFSVGRVVSTGDVTAAGSGSVVPGVTSVPRTSEARTRRAEAFDRTSEVNLVADEAGCGRWPTHRAVP